MITCSATFATPVDSLTTSWAIFETPLDAVTTLPATLATSKAALETSFEISRICAEAAVCSWIAEDSSSEADELS